MANGITLMIVVVVLLGILALHGECCKCRQKDKHPQQHYCTADYVVLAGILDREVAYMGNMPMEIHYMVNIKRVYKSVPEYENATKNMIISPALQSACGLEELQRGTNYLITGRIVNGSLQTLLCDWVQPYNTLSKAQRNGVRSKYERGCQCEFAYCNGENCDRQQYSNAMCEWESGDLEVCFFNDAICYYEDGECSWKETKKFITCEEQVYGFGGVV